MLTKKITYTDFDGNERTEQFYFNLTRTEITELELTYPGGYSNFITKMIDAHDQPSLMKMFKDLIMRSYGEKSEDGRRLVKSEELSRAFGETNAYDELFMELCTDSDSAVRFVTGVMPDMGDPGAKEKLIEDTKARIAVMSKESQG